MATVWQSTMPGSAVIDLAAAQCSTGAVCLYTPVGPPNGYMDAGPNGCGGYCSGGCLSDSDCATGDSSRSLVCRPILLSANGGSCDGGSSLLCGAQSMYCVFSDAG